VKTKDSSNVHYLKDAKKTEDASSQPQHASKIRSNLNLGAPLTGVVMAAIFYFAGPWSASLLDFTPGPAWVYSVFGFGIGICIGIEWFGFFQEPTE
jgi:hypothetical protein